MFKALKILETVIPSKMIIVDTSDHKMPTEQGKL